MERTMMLTAKEKLEVLYTASLEKCDRMLEDAIARMGIHPTEEDDAASSKGTELPIDWERLIQVQTTEDMRRLYRAREHAVQMLLWIREENCAALQKHCERIIHLCTKSTIDRSTIREEPPSIDALRNTRQFYEFVLRHVEQIALKKHGL